jgi:RND family efflux transporter MFP subunit
MGLARPLALALALVSSLAPLGCKRPSEAAKLPPASGPGAPPPPVLPAVGGEENVEGKSTAPTEGKTTGTTYPRAEAQVGPNGQGVIAKIFFKEGDRVKKGATLFRLDNKDARLRVEQAEAALAAARVNLKATEVEHQRSKGLFDQKALNQMQWDQIQARLDGAKVGMQQAEVAVSMARKFATDATVRSPIDGVVAMKLKSEGEMATMMPPTVVLVLQDQSTLELRFRMPEHALAKVKPGTPLKIRFEALNVTREARVSRIQPTVDPRTRTVEMVAELANSDGALKSGLLAQVEIAP